MTLIDYISYSHVEKYDESLVILYNIFYHKENYHDAACLHHISPHGASMIGTRWYEITYTHHN